MLATDRLVSIKVLRSLNVTWELVAIGSVRVGENRAFNAIFRAIYPYLLGVCAPSAYLACPIVLHLSPLRARASPLLSRLSSTKIVVELQAKLPSRFARGATGELVWKTASIRRVHEDWSHATATSLSRDNLRVDRCVIEGRLTKWKH